MRILHTVEFYHPSIGGMQEVVRQLSERLVRLGHDVTVATTELPDRKENVLNGVKIKGFSVAGNEVRGLTGDIAGYREFLLDSDFDIIVNFAAQQWATDIMLPVLERVKGRKVFVPTGFSGLYMPSYRDYFEKLKRHMLQYDMNVFLSDDYWDINFARGHGINATTLIPNGAGADEFLGAGYPSIRGKYGIPDDHLLILHVGSHTGMKGHMEAVEMFERAKIENATLLIVGNYAPESVRLPIRGPSWLVRKLIIELKLMVSEYMFDIGGKGACPYFCSRIAGRFNSARARNNDGKRLIIESLNRRQTVGAYKEADLFLFPSRIECSPLVLFECMASRTPFLSTDVGNAREIAGWSGSGIILPTDKRENGYSFVDIVKSIPILEGICGDKAVREAMAARGFAAWKERFTWEKITGEYESLYKRLLIST